MKSQGTYFLALIKVLIFVMFTSFLTSCLGMSSIAMTSRFEHRVIDATPNAGEDCCLDVLAVGDIDNDNLTDVVAGSENSKRPGLVWYSNPGWQKHEIASGQFTTDAKIFDIDKDGWNDIIVSNNGTGLIWYKNPGIKGGTWKANMISDSYAHDIIVTDLDGDNLLDIVIATKKKIIIYFQRKNANWQEYPLIENNGEGIAAADIDMDSDQDIIFGASWFENIEPNKADNPGNIRFRRHIIDGDYPSNTRVAVADINEDSSPDVILTVSEGDGYLVYYESSLSEAGIKWIKHTVSDIELNNAHSLQVADFDNDGDYDILTAEMHTSNKKRVLVFFQAGDKWHAELLADTGSHNMQIADIDNDNDVDIVGKNYAGARKPVELWVNKTRSNPDRLSLDDWTYINIDDNRDEDQYGKMGLIFTDINQDDYPDIVAGSYVYLNPNGILDGDWKTRKLGDGIDIYFSLDMAAGDAAYLVGISKDNYLSLVSYKSDSDEVSIKRIFSLPKGRTQGYIKQQVSGYTYLYFTRGEHLFRATPSSEITDIQNWKISRISNEVEEEGIALLDMDDDGDQDIIATARISNKNYVVWLENNGPDGNTNLGNWKRHIVGQGDEWLDRLGVLDVNHDGVMDIIATEETMDTKYNANIYWYEVLKNLTAKRHVIAKYRSVNSLDIKDMDGDGDMDVVFAEHTDITDEDGEKDNLTGILENTSDPEKWTLHKIDVSNHSSHLGAKAVDLDLDGDMDVVSIAWEQYKQVHLWRNDAPNRSLLLSGDYAR